MHWLLVKVLCPTQHKIGHFRDVPKPISWLGIEKQNPTQQKHIFTNQKKCTTSQNKYKKLKPGLVTSYDIWPGNGEGLFWFWHFINLSLTYSLRHSLTYSPGPTQSPPNCTQVGSLCLSCYVFLTYLFHCVVGVALTALHHYQHYWTIDSTG